MQNLHLYKPTLHDKASICQNLLIFKTKVSTCGAGYLNFFTYLCLDLVPEKISLIFQGYCFVRKKMSQFYLFEEYD